MVKKLVFVLVMSLIVFVGWAYAQHNGNGDCVPGEAQQNAFQNGGLGFSNGDGSRQWNGQRRDQMGRGTSQGDNDAVGYYATLPPATVETLPDDIVDLVIRGWMDEQNAYAAYEAIMATFGEVRPFVNIQRAEAQHIAAWEFIMARYAIDLPELPEPDLVVPGTVEVACQLGAEAEIDNFSLYDEMLEAFEPYPDIYQVALVLRNASEFNHLPAFERCAN